MNRLSETERDLGMVCDAYGLPHDAVALARHLASNAELDHAVMTETNRLLAARLASVKALADKWADGPYLDLRGAAITLRAVLGFDAHTEQKGTGR